MMRSLSELVITTEVDQPHIEFAVQSVLDQATATPAAFGFPSDAEHEAARVYMCAVLARVGMHLTRDLSAARYHHKCGSWWSYGADVETGAVTDVCGVSSYEDECPRLYVTVPVGTKAKWTSAINVALADVLADVSTRTDLPDDLTLDMKGAA